jgi:anti-sigma-K factor RskA
MRQVRDRTNERSDALLHAYHDGELTGLARWRFERRLRRSPDLRAELEEVAALGEMLREQDAAEPAPDLWDAIAPRLAALDAERIDVLALPAGPGLWDRLEPWLRPLGAVAATAAVVLAVLYGGFWQDAPTAGGVVRWIDSGNRSVVVLDDDPDTTIIWVLDPVAEGAWIGGGRAEA